MEITYIMHKGSGPELEKALAECRRIAESDLAVEKDIENHYGLRIAYNRNHTPCGLVSPSHLTATQMRNAGVRLDPRMKRRWFWEKSQDFPLLVPDMQTSRGKALERMLEAVIGLPAKPAEALTRFLGMMRCIQIGSRIFWTESVMERNLSPRDGDASEQIVRIAVPCEPGCPFSFVAPAWMQVTELVTNTLEPS